MIPWALDIVEVCVIPDLSLSVYLPDAPPGAMLDIPCYVYLLTRPGETVVIDSGADRIASAAAGFSILGDTRAAILDALRPRNRAAEDVGTLIQSHLHYDHMKYVALFPRARVVVRRRELDWAQSVDHDRFYVGIGEFLDEIRGRLENVEGERDVLEGITLLSNGGHTPGHQSLLVGTADGPVCLCADIIPMAANLKIPAPSQNPAETRALMGRIVRTGWELLPGHDPTLRQHRRYVHRSGAAAPDLQG